MKYDIAMDVELFGDCLVILHTILSYKNESFSCYLSVCNVHAISINSVFIAVLMVVVAFFVIVVFVVVVFVWYSYQF